MVEGMKEKMKKFMHANIDVFCWVLIPYKSRVMMLQIWINIMWVVKSSLID